MKIGVLFKPSVGKNQFNYLNNSGRRKTNREKRWQGLRKNFSSLSCKYESRGHNCPWVDCYKDIYEFDHKIYLANMEDNVVLFLLRRVYIDSKYNLQDHGQISARDLICSRPRLHDKLGLNGKK